MKIEHIAIWVSDLEVMRDFYINYFGFVSNDKYINVQKGYSSYFLSIGNGNTRIELMNRLDICKDSNKRGLILGLAHLAISVGDKEAVNQMTEKLRANNFIIVSEPRTTGDGYYESVILDPEGNHIEIVA